MKIGVDGIPLNQAKTGVGHYTSEIALALATAYPDDEFQVVSQIPFAPGASETDRKNLEFIQQPVNEVTKHWWTIGLPRYLSRNSIDLFHGTNYDIPVWGGTPTVLTIHDLSLLLFPETHEERRVKRARRRLPVMARLATRIIVPTESVKREVEQHLPVASGKVMAVAEAPRNCFSPMNERIARQTTTRFSIEDLFILYVGAIEPRKNLKTLVKAVEEVYKGSELRPQLVIAGPTGWKSDDLFAYVDQSPIKNRVLLTGYVGDEDLRALYSTCRVMIYPALYEGAGLPPLEAMACAAPVITSDATAVVEMVGDGALSVSATDYRALAKSIVELLMDSPGREALRQRGLRRSKQFTWERAANLTYQVYLDALEQPRRFLSTRSTKK